MNSLSPELYWTTATAVMTSVMWAPHILQRIFEMKPYKAFRDPRHDEPTLAPFAQRAIRAHTNAVENLVVFGLLAIIIHLTSAGDSLTAQAALVYFVARAAHYVIYVTAVPWMRTPVYLVSWACQIVLGGRLLGWW